MANFITNWFNDQIQRVASAIADRVLTESGQTVVQARAYRLGKQERQLKVKPGQYDDNLILNFTGLIINRSVSQMFGGGIDFHFGEEGEEATETTPQEEYIRAVWDANKIEILLHRAALAAAEAGTGYMMIHDPSLEMGSMRGEDGVEYPRLVMLDPAFVTMETLPEDFEIVVKYIIMYKYTDAEGKEKAHKREIEQAETGSWAIVDYDNVNGKWVEIARIDWPYDFCPVVHWQNLPTIDTPYGEPEITGGLMEVQDKINADISFLSKSLRLGADPLRYFAGTRPPERADIGPDKAVFLGADGTAGQLAPTTDWPGQIKYLDEVRAAMFNIARTVDLDSLTLSGDITNFRVRVIYGDNISKIDTKRELMGDALEEINRNLLIMAGMEPIHTEVIWPDFVPENRTEDAQYWQALQALGVISKQTLAEKLELDWEQERERIGSEREESDNIGATLLRQAARGQENGIMPALGGNVENTGTRSDTNSS